MKSLQTSFNKDVSYFGIDFTTPMASQFLATDSDGMVFAYLFKPTPPTDGTGDWVTSGPEMAYAIGEVDLEGEDFAATLVAI